MKLKDIYLIPDMEHIDESLRLAKQYHARFEYNDFFLPKVYLDEAEVEKRIYLYQSLERDRSKDTLHGAFLDVTIHSQDAQMREISRARVRQSLEIARRLGVRGVVFHANLIAGYYDESYLNGWFEASVEFFKEMLMAFPKLEIYVENMFESRPDELKRLAEAMKDEPRFGLCLDYAHATVFGKDVSHWVNELAPYIKHLHVNDNDLEGDRHWAVGDGQINWMNFSDILRKNNVDASMLLEVRGNGNWKKSVEYMEEHAIYPW